MINQCVICNRRIVYGQALECKTIFPVIRFHCENQIVQRLSGLIGIKDDLIHADRLGLVIHHYIQGILRTGDTEEGVTVIVDSGAEAVENIGVCVEAFAEGGVP